MNQKVLKEISDLKLKMNGFGRSESDASVVSHISREGQLLTEHSSMSPDDTESSIYAVEKQRTHQSTSPSRNRATSNKQKLKANLNLHDYASRLTEVERQSNEAIKHLRSEVRENAQMSNSTRISLQKELEQMSSKIDSRLSSTLKKLQEEHAKSRKEVEAVLGRFTVSNSSCEQKDLLKSLTNVAESVQAVKAALLKKIEDFENETKEKLTQLDSELDAMKSKQKNDE
nr:unnamed protein product [Spirometra erinaceieuropaei]